MRRIQYHRYGGPETMQLEAFELRRPGNGEVAVKVAFAAINPIDWKVRDGQLKMVTGKTFPRGFGIDFSGTVSEIGPGVTRFKVGDAVFGAAKLKEGGAVAEAVIAPETFIAKKPADVSFEQAACLGTPGITAWNGIVDKAQIKAGDHVFVNGATGAVGQAAAQIARMFGANVSGTASAGQIGRAEQMGVHPVLDYRATDLSRLKERFDAVYDTAGTMTVATGLGLLRKGGVFLDLTPTPGKFIRALFSRRLKPIVCTARADILDGLAKAAGEGRLSLPIARTVPLHEAIPEIVELEQGRKLNGKLVVAMP